MDKHLARLAADGMKRANIELGGHAPVLVFDDADVDAAAGAGAVAKFRTAGQVCVSRTRFTAQAFVTSTRAFGLMTRPAWESARPAICCTLALSTNAPAEVARLAARLDAAYRDTAANLHKNASVQVDGGELVLSAFGKLEEPASLVALNAAARLPRVSLPELLLEMHACTAFANGSTHASEGGARAGDVATSICAVLVARPATPALSH